MRIMIKGGVWKNTEDEILKAAVMKYGKNQWARISSLLVRKSAKQCKARWFEWLDPSIKKTEWTREEEEKLLHLAKIMPTQWRTIAPIIGRTPSQCLERYEKLLDAAQQKSGGMDDKDDPRRLRPGEIDPNPEAKPARPDPVDMDEDEKEMLSEARARLSNTQGKKAKRKAREKQLEEARRLAQLQKRREMKEAGISWRRGGHHRKRKWGVDYNAEIPFYKKAPKGYFDTSAEKSQGFKVRESTNFLGKSAEELNGERRDVIEERERKKDARRQKLHRKTNLQEHLLRINKMNDAPSLQHRAEMILPAPQLSENDLEQISKVGGVESLQDRGAPTSTLVGEYEQTPSAAARTPMRTPRTKDTVMEEAQNIIALRNTQTPLLGGDNVAAETNFGGVTPKHARLTTPNPLATPSRVGMTPARGSMTPMSVASGATGVTGVTGLTATPARDHLGINADGSMTPSTAIAERRRLKQLKKKMKTGFGKLPKARNKYSIVLPELPPEVTEDDEIEEDAEDAQALRDAREKAKEELAMKKRSQALQRNLPRPLAIGQLRFASDTQDEETQMIYQEMDKLIRHDEVKHVIQGAPLKHKRRLVEIDDFSLEEIDEARSMIDKETQKTLPEDVLKAYEQIWTECYENILFLPTKKAFGKLSSVSKKDQLTAIKQEFELARQHLARDTKKAQKMTQKLDIMLGGYKMRVLKLSKKIQSDMAQTERQLRDSRCFQELANQESTALPIRVKTIEREVQAETEKEAGAQQKFAKLMQEKESLMAELKIVNEVI
mmetsp:Transcript_13614/g.25976  ORF Transcript_13614/g.25976 Transcript_13614/m.25976 type:complete len:779 (-) Transcript_13614:123-2459(-)